ncbi:MAG TPA: trypsin-like peptidase domain-containing protein [Planctomycetota bacterium]|nr:trypsin-like peptidase domain-containing protein [Planctomycetota bacterium]OQC21177.1 MAG: putative periplasmic serine endoprotease DegP-like precursor [Planctomycetes bacterium ADurb.Bin069]NMD34358.1 PDZ domain-containing protein [Planctomycetota bacterium]HNR99146.1 trypsin-like peptidase domain-containing protein [Planctomycetota bacterium]HNU25817.1 trypsin-like peptidase domain-containing protein [Planctomycetota bacterium]
MPSARTLLSGLKKAILLAALAAALSAGEAPWFHAAVCEVLVDGHVACSGFFVDSGGRCLTCAHGVAAGKTFEVLLNDGRRLRAALVGMDAGADAAVLAVEGLDAGGVACLKFAAEAPGVGAALRFAGTALYRRRLVLAGAVARADTAFEYNPDLKTYVEVFYVDASTVPGMSGGPWLDGEGRVVGLQSGGILLNGAFCGVAFAVPARLLRPLAEQPAGTPPRGDIGAACDELWELPSAAVKRFSGVAAEGLLVCRVLKGGACDKAGIADGDLIVGLDGGPCRFREDFVRAVRGWAPGRTIELTVVRERQGVLVRETAALTLADARAAPALPPK